MPVDRTTLNPFSVSLSLRTRALRTTSTPESCRRDNAFCLNSSGSGSEERSCSREWISVIFFDGKRVFSSEVTSMPTAPFLCQLFPRELWIDGGDL